MAQGIALAKRETCLACGTLCIDQNHGRKQTVSNRHNNPNAQTIRRRRRMAAFLALYSEHGSLGAACRSIHVRPSQIRQWRLDDPTFEALYLDAAASFIGRLEKEAFTRAVIGEEHPVVSAGKLVTYEVKKSDDLLKVLMRANDPKKYREGGRQLGMKAGVDEEGNKFFKVYEGFDPDDV